MSHWHNAQEEQREHGTNIVTAQDDNGSEIALVGNASMGWRLVTPERTLRANTSHDLEGVFDEFNIPFLGWS